MSLDYAVAIQKLNSIFETYAAAKASAASSVVLSASTATGKVYEAWILASVLDKLQSDEGFTVTYNAGSELRLKAAPGPINPAYAHFILTRPDLARPLIVWTDIEFLTLSYANDGHLFNAPIDGDYHELDIVVVSERVNGRPRHDDVLLGIECKNSAFGKDLLRAALGVRRELSLFRNRSIPTVFHSWPRSEVRADPPSCLSVYSTAGTILKYQKNADTFGIDLIHEPILM